jgi:hypothetical protein
VVSLYPFKIKIDDNRTLELNLRKIRAAIVDGGPSEAADKTPIEAGDIARALRAHKVFTFGMSAFAERNSNMLANGADLTAPKPHAVLSIWEGMITFERNSRKPEAVESLQAELDKLKINYYNEEHASMRDEIKKIVTPVRIETEKC